MEQGLGRGKPDLVPRDSRDRAEAVNYDFQTDKERRRVRSRMFVFLYVRSLKELRGKEAVI